MHPGGLWRGRVFEWAARKRTALGVACQAQLGKTCVGCTRGALEQRQVVRGEALHGFSIEEIAVVFEQHPQPVARRVDHHGEVEFRRRRLHRIFSHLEVGEAARGRRQVLQHEHHLEERAR